MLGLSAAEIARKTHLVRTQLLCLTVARLVIFTTVGFTVMQKIFRGATTMSYIKTGSQ